MGHVGAILALISTISATTTSLPSWQRMKILDQELACYNFEKAKDLKLFENDCLRCQRDLTLKDLELESLKMQFNQAVSIIQLDSKIIKDALAHTASVTAQRDAYIQKYIEADSRDILGGGLPWMITALVIGVIIGGGTVIYLQH